MTHHAARLESSSQNLLCELGDKVLIVFKEKLITFSDVLIRGASPTYLSCSERRSDGC